MAEEVDAQRQAFMDELGMTYVELEKAAIDQEKAPPAQDIGSASNASDGSPTPATAWGFFEANADEINVQTRYSTHYSVASCAAWAPASQLRLLTSAVRSAIRQR